MKQFSVVPQSHHLLGLMPIQRSLKRLLLKPIALQTNHCEFSRTWNWAKLPPELWKCCYKWFVTANAVIPISAKQFCRKLWTHVPTKSHAALEDVVGGQASPLKFAIKAQPNHAHGIQHGSNILQAATARTLWKMVSNCWPPAPPHPSECGRATKRTCSRSAKWRPKPQRPTRMPETKPAPLAHLFRLSSPHWASRDHINIPNMYQHP